jgi:hypothetical protein
MICEVETYSGFRLHEYPRRFTWQGNWLEVTRVRRQGRSPETLDFEILAADGCVYLLTHHLRGGEWQVRRHEASIDRCRFRFTF